ncbi:hypothetical protein [Nonomuraea ferruginea]|uniref:Uncharacterized protein n=1 Tax=Nonomuraea ferruginea TaxID=46174 RepID=A0ABT4T1G0_9ACTN|nr:hypothetical protein [Nonomuraea ferruginea]MDA0643356.1 hypothetical protein [Nonomuraea ferruginea]
MYLIYRSWDQGVLGKRVWRMPQPTVLEWVHDVWEDATAGDPHEWFERELGTDVWYLAALFEGGAPPRSMEELRTLARTRVSELQQCNVDARSVRVLADSLWYEVAYYLVDDSAVAANPGLWSYAVHDGPLPATVNTPAGGFTPPWKTVDLAGSSGTGTVYAVLLTCRARHFSIGRDDTYAFRGIRLPEFAAALRSLGTTGEWPLELMVLRSLIAPDEDGIAAALERCNRWPGYAEPPDDYLADLSSHAAALELIRTARGREGTVIHVDEHVVQMLIAEWGETREQWFFFDDRWAGGHPDLAASLMWFAYHWDPLCSRHHFRDKPCSDNRVLYIAVMDEDGRVRVREAGPMDDERFWKFYRWHHSRRPLGEVTAGDVLGAVEVQFQQPAPDSCRFTEFQITRTSHGPAVAAMLADRIRHDLKEAGITRSDGWLQTGYPHGRRFFRAVGRLRRSADGSDFLVIS